MSRYSDFQEDDENPQQVPPILTRAQQSELVCIHDLIPSANPLMDKIEYVPYVAQHYYPVRNAGLPGGMNEMMYHNDANHMMLLDQSVFAHERMRKQVEKCLGGVGKKQPKKKELSTLKQYYCNKQMVYEKYQEGEKEGRYFATFLLKINQMQHDPSLNTTNRQTKTALPTSRAHSDRLNPSLPHRSSIQFNSNFESGNLFRVYQREHNQYDLVLQNDINTKGNNQWFFYSVRGVAKGATIRMNIVNMSKSYSLFEVGMKPSVFSMVRWEKRKVGWCREGSKVEYRQSGQLRKESSQSPYYSLSFQYKFHYEGDIVYFSMAMPYTYQHLTHFLTSSLANRQHHKTVKIRLLGRTLGGNEVSLFDVSNWENKQAKKSVWVMARQHSGETTSSFMMEGIITYLLSNSLEAKYLLDHYVFRIVPMLNIDGVVHGNSRAELFGCDSNRSWQDPHKAYNPVVYNLRRMIRNDNVEMVLDLHSHSRKLGTFFYANRSTAMSNTIKVFPMMVCKNDQRFDYRHNRFRGGSNLTARKVLFDLLKIPYVYTVQSSFFGYQKPNEFKIMQYQPSDYQEMGRSILVSLAEIGKKRNFSTPLDQRLLLCPAEELAQSDSLWARMNEADEVESVGSDEDPAQDQFTKKQLQLLMPNKTRTKTKKKKVLPQSKQIKSAIRERVKHELVQPKTTSKIDKESHYKKYFSGRLSYATRHSQSHHERIQGLNRPQCRNIGLQVDMPERNVLNRSSFINMAQEKVSSGEKLALPRKGGLCVIGQRMEQDLILSGLSVGAQVDLSRVFLRSRNQMHLVNQSLPKRASKPGVKLGMLMMLNENNFLSRGQSMHTTMRVFGKR